jgi:thiosulfate/3-mercaptopyruvate sulfurtransferase
MSANFVNVGWLAEHHEAVVLLDASIHRDEGEFGDGRADFAASHLPGAQFADLFAAFSDPDAEFLFTRPTVSQFEAAARAVGISDDSTVVVYDRLTGAWAARIWWVFRSFGFDNVRVLDGGMAAWLAAGHAVATGPAPQVAAGSLVARPQEGFFTDLTTVKHLIDDVSPRIPVVCALRRADYEGGHLPGSVSLAYPDLLHADGTLSLASVHAGVVDLGLDSASEAVLYCGGGINASGLALALTEAGYAGFSVYDGSLNEWKADPTLPLTVGEAP